MMNGVLWALLGTLFTFGVTTLGALNVYWVRGEITEKIQCVFLGFAGGVMIAASVWSLLLPAIDRAEELHQIGWLVTTSGFLLGVCSLLGADALFKRHCMRRLAGGSISSLKQRTLMMIGAITIHNIPEGTAVGLAFAMAASEAGNSALFSGAVALALGIGIQNYPEGTAVALPLHSDGMSKKKAFAYGALSGVVEPIGALLTVLLTTLVQPILPFILAFAAGAMIYVVVEELIPESQMGLHSNIGTIGAALGFALLMVLDVALG